MQELYSEVTTEINKNRDLSYELEVLASAFEAIGNQKVSNQLYMAAYEMRRIAIAIDKAFGRYLTKTINASNKEIGETLNALLK